MLGISNEDQPAVSNPYMDELALVQLMFGISNEDQPAVSNPYMDELALVQLMLGISLTKSRVKLQSY